MTHQLGVVDNYSVETGALWRDDSDPEAPLMQIYFRSRKSAGSYYSRCPAGVLLSWLAHYDGPGGRGMAGKVH